MIQSQSRLSELHLRVNLDEQIFRNFGFLGHFKSTLNTQDEIYEAHYKGIFRVKGQHFKKDLAGIYFLERFQSFQGQSGLLSAVQVCHFFDYLKVIFPFSFQLRL